VRRRRSASDQIRSGPTLPTEKPEAPYREAYEQAGTAHGLLTDVAAEREVDVEFGGDDEAEAL